MGTNARYVADYQKYCIESGEYDYGDYFEEIDYAKRIFRECSDKHLANGLVEFLKQSGRVSGKESGELTEKRAKMKTNEILEGHLKSQEHKEIVSEAVSEGFVWKFRIKELWHPKIFFSDNKVTTFPYQHQFLTIYSGQPRHIFFSSKKEQFVENTNYLRNPGSMLSQNKLKAGATYIGDGDEGLWFGFLKTAAGYPMTRPKKAPYRHDVVLELEIQTEGMELGIKDRPNCQGLKEMKEEFHSPERFRKYVDSQGTNHFEFILSSDVSCKDMTGVWDSERFKTPHFSSLPKEIEYLDSEYLEWMPPPDKRSPYVRSLMTEKDAEIFKHLEEEVERKFREMDAKDTEFGDIKQGLKNIGGNYSGLISKLIKINQNIEFAFNHPSKHPEEILGDRIGGIVEIIYDADFSDPGQKRAKVPFGGINANVKSLHSELEEKYDVEIDTEKVSAVKALENGEIQSLEEECENMVKSINAHHRKAARAAEKGYEQELEQIFTDLREEIIDRVSNLKTMSLSKEGIESIVEFDQLNDQEKKVVLKVLDSIFS